MNGPYPDLQIQRYLEGSLPVYDEDLLFRSLCRGGALADRFVELRELECGLAEYFGRCPRLSKIAAAPASGDLSHARRFPASGGPRLPEECAEQLMHAYRRWLQSTEIIAHRRAVVHCMGLILEESREFLRCRHRLGMSCREISEEQARPSGEIEESIRRIHAFIAGCVRMRLSRTG